MAFSGALTLTDLNDFISPSQACIKPVEELNKEELKSQTGAKTEIVIDSSGSYYEVFNEGPSTQSSIADSGSGQKLKQAQISLNDCLACSGCITSAESILITLQSHVEVLSISAENKDAPQDTRKALVASISPQTLASLATSLSTNSPPKTPIQILRRVKAFFKEELGFAEVFDTTFARHISLREHVLEFEERRDRDKLGGETAEGQLPMLASACPGWICYAEKAHSEMLPFISTTKSPQQVMGTLVKEWMGKKWGKSPDQIYHVSIMPCYDKKLEASRKDFYDEVYSTRDVDCVITTGELELMMKERNWDLRKPVANELHESIPSSSTSEVPHLPELLQHPGSSSGSYLQSIINHIIRTSEAPLSLTSKIMRNADYEEFILTDEASNKVVFKGAKCYGFRNLQNVVRKVGRDKGVRVGGGAAGKLGGKGAVAGGVGRRVVRKGVSAKSGEGNRQYDYVEVMACPGGCVNGGGQLKPMTSTAATPPAPDQQQPNGSLDEEGYSRNWEESGMMQNAKWGDKDWTRKVEEMYWILPGLSPSGQEARSVQIVEADVRGERIRGIISSGVRGADGLGDNHGESPITKAPRNRVVVVGGENQEMDGYRPHDLREASNTSAIVIDPEQVTLPDVGSKGAGINQDDSQRTRRIEVGNVDRPIGGLGPGTWPRREESPPPILRRQFAIADEVTERILEEICRPTEECDVERKRHQFFRTQYHAVESEVIGLAVKW